MLLEQFLGSERMLPLESILVSQRQLCAICAMRRDATSAVADFGDVQLHRALLSSIAWAGAALMGFAHFCFCDVRATMPWLVEGTTTVTLQ